MSAKEAAEICHFDLLQQSNDFGADLTEGLTREQKTIPPKYLYDKRGSELFELECQQPEYYLPEVEGEIFRQHASAMAPAFGTEAVLVEPGSGASKKVCALLDNMEDPAGYVAIDISTQFMKEAVQHLAELYPKLPMACVSADFFDLNRLPVPILRMGRSRVLFFPGSTIGNVEPVRARGLLASFRDLVGPDGVLLIGVDMEKPREIVESAYRDEQGVADQLHLNLLTRANRELDADFDRSRFRYETFYNADKCCMEMYLVSKEEQEVRVKDRNVVFEADEHIRTGSSYKYTPERFHDLAEKAGCEPVDMWTDSQNYFSVHLLRAG